jgi:DNA-binding transcriptional MocR family regulator
VVLQSNTDRTIGAARFALLVEDWREASTGPLARRLAHVIRSRIAGGLLRAGTFLPPERSIAGALGVSRSTVVGALDELRAAGLVISQQGRGTWVAGAEPGDPIANTTAERLLLGPNSINLAASVPSDASHLPDLELHGADLAAVTPAHGYAPAGLPALRDAIAKRHRALGMPSNSEQIHVTNGAQHALHLALGAVTRPGDVVAIEDPTYVGVFDLLEARGLEPLPLPLDVVEGASERLSNLLRAGRARALLLVPAVHSPTGRVRRRPDLARLARRLDRIGLPVVEDNTVADLVFAGTRPPALGALCERAPVISVESTSKVAWGGLRVGWLRTDRSVIERTVIERERTDFGTSVPAQLFALRLLEHYDDLVAARRHVLAQRAKLFARLLRKELPEWKAEAPAGGLSTWVDIGRDADAFAPYALRHGVTVAPGSSASRHETARNYLRVCFDRPAVELEAAATRLRHAVEDARGWR